MRDPRSVELSDLLNRVLSQWGAFSALFGVLVYALQSIAYDQFYGNLDIDPSDVGLGYSKVLAQSLRLSILLFVGLLVAGIPWLYARLFLRSAGSLHEGKRRYRIASVASALIVICWIGWLNADSAHDASSAVKYGQPVIRTGRFFTIPNLRASPVVVKPVGIPKESPAITELDCDFNHIPPSCSRIFLYMGRNDGIAVLYSVSKQRSIRVPESSVELQISNCIDRPRDLSCEGAYQG